MANYTITYNEDDKIIDTQKVVTSTWSNNTNELTTVYTSSTQADFTSATSKGSHYIEVYNEATSSTNSAVQYAVAYGHRKGSGSLDFTNAVGSKGNSPSKIIYNQYRQLVYGDETRFFDFDGGVNSGTDSFIPDDIYVININRGRYKNNLKPGTLNIILASGSAKLHLTDNSITTTGSAVITNAGRQFTIVSGSNGIRSGSNTIQILNSGSYGKYYPDSGFIILNPAALDHTLSGSIDFGALTPNTTANTAANNHQKLLNAIDSGSSFIVDSEETISSQYLFTRIKNSEFNFTTNPSFVDNNSNLKFGSMENNPKVFITTVGLYNNTNELVAVAKLSQPIVKDFSKEALIRVKLDY